MEMKCYYQGLCTDIGDKCGSCRWRFAHSSYYEPVVQTNKSRVSNPFRIIVPDSIEYKLDNKIFTLS
jgi:hypothetical protein